MKKIKFEHSKELTKGTMLYDEANGQTYEITSDGFDYFHRWYDCKVYEWNSETEEYVCIDDKYRLTEHDVVGKYIMQ